MVHGGAPKLLYLFAPTYMALTPGLEVVVEARHAAFGGAPAEPLGDGARVPRLMVDLSIVFMAL